MYDVIIVGAGPTGSSAAKKLANDGFKVLMVERFKMPRNKPCSGILIKKTVDLVKTYFNENIPESVASAPINNKGLIYTDDTGHEYRYEQNSQSVWRSSFDMWLAEMAVAAGAELRDETAAIFCEGRINDVIIKLRGQNEYSEKAKIVILCEGATGTIKPKLTSTNHNHVFTYQTFNRGFVELDPHYFYAYLQPDLAEYNAWFNVKDDYLVFGVAGKSMGKIEQYYSKFISYMKTRHNAQIEAKVRDEKWTMPGIVPGCPIDYGKGRVLFAGETAGFLNPMGEGMSAALECGYAAADAIGKAENFNIQSVYSGYKDNVSELSAYMKRQWKLIGSMSDKFTHMK